MTDTDTKARAAANLADAFARAGMSDPADRAAHAAAIQAHVPRMVAHLNDAHHRAMLVGDRDAQIAALARTARADNAKADADAMLPFSFDVLCADSKDAIMAKAATTVRRVHVLGTDRLDARLAAEQLVAACGDEPLACTPA
jgi:hypothetical protein